MIAFGLFLALTSSPYAFEVDDGVAAEAVIGTSFLDKEDRNAANGGVRLTYIQHDERDTLITGELQILSQTIFTGSTYETPRYKWMGDLSLAFYEFYHPFAFRVLGGPCIERRISKWNYGLSYRGGLGFYLKSSVALFADLGGRWIGRKTQDSMPYDLSLSLQFIF